MFIPTWLLIGASVLVAGFVAWSFLLASGRNPLPFPDHGSRIFSAATPQAKDAIVALLAANGLKERFQFNTEGVRRSIMWDGTIINCSAAEISQKLGSATSSIGLVSADPVVSATTAAAFLRAKGFVADVVLDAEPELPIAFVVTNALSGTVLNFRKHVIHMPKPQPAGAQAE